MQRDLGEQSRDADSIVVHLLDVHSSLYSLNFPLIQKLL